MYCCRYRALIEHHRCMPSIIVCWLINIILWPLKSTWKISGKCILDWLIPRGLQRWIPKSPAHDTTTNRKLMFCSYSMHLGLFKSDLWWLRTDINSLRWCWALHVERNGQSQAGYSQLKSSITTQRLLLMSRCQDHQSLPISLLWLLRNCHPHLEVNLVQFVDDSPGRLRLLWSLHNSNGQATKPIVELMKNAVIDH